MTMTRPPFALAEELERHLGDPRDDATPFSYARCAAEDAREAFPADACRAIDRFGLPAYYVPASLGGRLDDVEQVLNGMRMIARRDLTVAIAHGKTFLGAVCAWIAGPPELARRLAGHVVAGAPVSWGLTERDHGSDLLAGEVSARPAAGAGTGAAGTRAGTGDYTVDGEKWLVNNATRGRFVSLLARTDPAGGPRGYDMLLVDKEELAPGSFRHLPKVRTAGIRGADISGIAFDGAVVPAGARIGAPGTGLETLLRGLQLTRTLCAVLSLGAGDAALRLAVDFAAHRVLYGRRLIDLPAARRTLLDAYADQLLAEALTTVAARSVHALAPELALTSAVVKYLVPTRTEATVAALGRLLGARSFLLDAPDGAGRFAKIARDNRIVGMFDGNTLVNLNAIVNHFPVLARAAGRGTVADPEGAEIVFDTRRSLPSLDLDRLGVLARHGSSVTSGLARDAARIAELAGRAGPSGAASAGRAGAAALAARLADLTRRRSAEVAAYRPRPVQAVPVAAFDLAQRFALCFAGAAAAGLWTAWAAGRAEHPGPSPARTGLGEAGEALWADGVWLRAVLARVLSALGEPVAADPDADAALLAALTRQAREGLLLSLWPCRLAEAGPC
jgi:alkylation response protein AidB-like acyl-CoA dehydrogenase